MEREDAAVSDATQSCPSREALLDRIRLSYQSSYDLSEPPADEAHPDLAMTGHYHVEESQYMISKRATMWQTESDEYVWFYSMPVLTDNACERAIRAAYDEGMAAIDLDGKKHHMVTRLTVIFLCDGMEEGARERIRKCRLYKNFQCSLRGWMEFHAVAADLGKESVVSNGYGRETANHLKTLMHPQSGRGRSRIWRILREMLH